MKYLYAFLLLSMIACEQYDAEPVPTQNLGSIQATPLTLISHKADILEDGAVEASIGGEKLQATAENGEIKWMLPNLAPGEYTLMLKQGGKSHTVQVYVQEPVNIPSPSSYIAQLNQELSLGFNDSKIEELSEEQQQAFAQFLASNKKHIEVEKKQIQKQSSSRTSSFYNSLNIGESATFEVASGAYWNGSGVFATAGQAFKVSASGTWKDWYIKTDADGYNSWQLALFTLLRRSKSDPWFKLIGASNQSRLYPVGSSAVIRPETGPLDFFANDAPGFYWNNYGSITVTVTRIE